MEPQTHFGIVVRKTQGASSTSSMAGIPRSPAWAARYDNRERADVGHGGVTVLTAGTGLKWSGSLKTTLSVGEKCVLANGPDA